MRLEGLTEIQGHLLFKTSAQPPLSPMGQMTFWYDSASGVLKASHNGGAYAAVLQGDTAAIANSNLAAPKIRVYQETVAFGAFTDGGAAAGTFDLSVSIPAGAVFLRTLLTALTGFAGDTSAVITVGDGTDVDRYNTGTPDVFTTAAAGVDMGAPSGTAFHSAAKTPKITITSGTDWGLVTAGALTLTLFWYQAT